MTTQEAVQLLERWRLALHLDEANYVTPGPVRNNYAAAGVKGDLRDRQEALSMAIAALRGQVSRG